MLTSSSTPFNTISTGLRHDSGRSESVVRLTTLYNRTTVFLNIRAVFGWLRWVLGWWGRIEAYRLWSYVEYKMEGTLFDLILIFCCFLRYIYILARLGDSIFDSNSQFISEALAYLKRQSFKITTKRIPILDLETDQCVRCDETLTSCCTEQQAFPIQVYVC